jgi:hypothetical protein
VVVSTQGAEAASAAVAACDSVDDDPAANRGSGALGSASPARILGGLTGGPVLSMDAVVALLQRTLRDGRQSRDRHVSAYRALRHAVVSGRGSGAMRGCWRRSHRTMAPG